LAILGLVAVTLGGGAVPAAASFKVATRWGREGSAPGRFGSGILGGDSDRQFDDPAGIAVARNGTVLVVDTSNNRVERFTARGRYLGRFGRRGYDKGSIRLILTDRFLQPEGIAVDRAGSIYVVDSLNDRVMKLSPSGRFRARLGKHGSSAGEWVQPWGIAAGGADVFVVDQGNYRIQRYSPGGRYRGRFGSFGRRRGQFVTPYGVAATPAGDRVYVTDLIRHRVMAFSRRGRLLAEWGGPGVRPGTFLKPAGVAVGRDGTVFVADRCNKRVQRFSRTGRFIESFGERVLQAPTFLALDRAGDVYVSDYHRVVKFAPSGRAPSRPRSSGRAAHHNGLDIWCRHVAELNGVDDTPTRNVPSPVTNAPLPSTFSGTIGLRRTDALEGSAQSWTSRVSFDLVDRSPRSGEYELVSGQVIELTDDVVFDGCLMRGSTTGDVARKSGSVSVDVAAGGKLSYALALSLQVDDVVHTAVDLCDPPMDPYPRLVSLDLSTSGTRRAAAPNGHLTASGVDVSQGNGSWDLAPG